MKSSKAVLGISVFVISAAVGAAVLMNNSNESFNLPVRAAEKSFTFDNRAFVVDQFNAKDTKEEVDVEVETDISSDEILTFVSYDEGGVQKDKLFGGANFVQNKDVEGESGQLKVTAGINNLTSFSATFGVTNADTEWCGYSLTLKDEDGKEIKVIAVNGDSEDIPANKDIIFNWTKTDEDSIYEVEFSFIALDTFDSIYFKSITLGWTC